MEKKGNQGIIKIPNPKSNIDWTLYLALMCVEDINEGLGSNIVAKIEGWSCLIINRICFTGKDWYNEKARYLIDKGYISKIGVINWKRVEDLTLDELVKE